MGVARATRPPRSATRRPELRRATLRKGRSHYLESLFPFRPAGRRTAQAGRLCYLETIFQTRSITPGTDPFSLFIRTDPFLFDLLLCQCLGPTLFRQNKFWFVT